MKKIAFILVLFVSSISWGQQFVVTEKGEAERSAAKPEEIEEKKIVTDDKEYMALLTYVPKSFIADTKSKPVNKVLRGDLNTIGSLELRYAYREQLKLNEAEVNWLEKEIVKLAAAFFNEGTPVLMERAGDYKACTGRGLETKIQDKQAVTVLHFCYVCAGAEVHEDRFLALFNNKTISMMEAKKRALANNPISKKKKAVSRRKI